jgi:hypothetical protein
MQRADAIVQAHQRLLSHPLLKALQTPAAWQIFMAHHVFAVWDFMSLAKRLQRDLTCVTLPWRPVPNPAFARFINEIILAEESDTDGQGGHCSHFDYYLQAMQVAGADRVPIDTFMAALAAGVPTADALQRHAPGPHVQRFVGSTLRWAFDAPTHVVAAVFFYGREDIIPAMFDGLSQVIHSGGKSLTALQRYFKRHIDLDGDSHGPLAAAMLDHLCAGEPTRLAAANAAAVAALESRHAFWSGIHLAITANPGLAALGNVNTA